MNRAPLIRILLWLFLAAILSLVALAIDAQEPLSPSKGQTEALAAAIPAASMPSESLIESPKPLPAEPIPFQPVPIPLQKPSTHLDRIEIPLLLLDASARALDCYSTRRMLDQGNREAILPRAIAGHPLPMAVYSASTIGVDWFTARWLNKRGHRRLARLTIVADLGQDLYFGVKNLTLPPMKGRKR